MIVIDASALAKFVLREEGSSQVLSHLRSGTVSPHLAVKEVANAIWRNHARGGASREQADVMLRVLAKLVGTSVRIEDQEPYIQESIRIAFQRKLTVYDSIYIAIAKAKSLGLLTADEGQFRAAEEEGVAAVLLA